MLPAGVACPFASSNTQCAAVATCVASRIVPPQNCPSAGEPAVGDQRATWKGYVVIGTVVPPTTRGVTPAARAPDPHMASTAATVAATATRRGGRRMAMGGSEVGAGCLVGGSASIASALPSAT